MGIENFSKGVSKDKIEQSRIDRNNKQNPPECEPGQGDDFMDVFDDFDSSVDSSSGGGFDDFAQGNFGSGFGQGFDQFNAGQPVGTPQQPQKQAEDIFFEALTTGGKHSWNFMKEITKASKGLTKRFWTVWGTNSIIVGCVLAGVGLVTRLFGLRLGGSVLVGGILTSATGVLVLMFNIDSVTPDMSQYVNEPNNSSEPQMSQDNSLGNSDDFNFDMDEFDDENFDEEEEPVYEDLDEDEEDFEFEEVDLTPKEPEKVLSSDEAIKLVQEVPVGMYTRQFLFDSYCKKLGHINPDFATARKIRDDSEQFDILYTIVQTAGKATGLSEDSLPELLSAEETLFTIRLVTTRVKGLTHDKLAQELVSIYRANEPDKKLKGGIFATSEAVGEECKITVFTGQKPLVSLKDMYNQCKDFLLDSKHLIPVVIGIDETGAVLIADFKNVESVLVAGMPRTGKSWTVQSIMSQMCAYCSPDELQFYIGDPKDGISDFKSFCLPHVKKFVSGDDNIVKMLDEIIHVEAPRRKKLLGDANVVNIWDYKEKYPDVKLPLIYVVIDEVVTLAMRMEKETKAEFQGYLTELISQLPALGIRAFLIPHVIKNDIIAKKTTDLIQCRISVCGDEEHIKDCLGVTPKDFKFKLSGKGELAVKMPEISASVLYCRSAILSTSNNENNDIFEYQRRLWNKISPNCCDDSVASNKDTDDAVKNLLDIEDTDISDDDFDIFNEMSLPANNKVNNVKSAMYKD